MSEFDEDTAFLGQTGRYFWSTFFLLNSVFVSTGFNGLYMVFIGSTPDHRCLIPDLNLTEEWRAAVIPVGEAEGGERVRSQCSRYSLHMVRNLSDQGLQPYHVNLSSLSVEPCLDGWSYSRDVYSSTIVTEWDLVCGDRWKVPVASSSLFVGYLLGSLISGQLSDRYGRKKVVFVSLVSQCVSVLLQSFSGSWRMFCLMFLFVGASQISLYLSAFVLGTELLSKTMRVIFTTLGAFLFYCLGYMTLPWIAFSIRDWRPLLATLATTSVVYIPLWWFIPESPRWLVTQGRRQEAECIVREAAKQNRVEAPVVIFKSEVCEPQQFSMVDVLRHRNIRCITLMCLGLWMAINIGYFGLSLNTSNLSGDPFMNCFLSAVSEVPAYVVSTWLLKRCPRRPLLSGFLLLGGGVLLLIQVLPEDLPVLALVLEMTGKFGFTMAFGIVYIFTAELYPTVIRNVGMGLCSSAARVGSITAPYVIHLVIRNMGMGLCSSAARVGSITAPYVIHLGTYSRALPYLVMGSLTVASCGLNFFLPETLNKDLPETMDQMQHYKGCCSRQKTQKCLEHVPNGGVSLR